MTVNPCLLSVLQKWPSFSEFQFCHLSKKMIVSALPVVKGTESHNHVWYNCKTTYNDKLVLLGLGLYVLRLRCGLSEIIYLKYFALIVPDNSGHVMVITLLIIVIHIANVTCSDLKFTCKAQSLVSFQRTLSASEISSRFCCFHFRITCNYFRISHYPYLTSLELFCYLSFKWPRQPTCNEKQ